MVHNVCSRPEDGLRCRLGVKLPLKQTPSWYHALNQHMIVDHDHMPIWETYHVPPLASSTLKGHSSQNVIKSQKRYSHMMGKKLPEPYQNQRFNVQKSTSLYSSLSLTSACSPVTGHCYSRDYLPHGVIASLMTGHCYPRDYLPHGLIASLMTGHCYPRDYLPHGLIAILDIVIHVTIFLMG